MEYWKFFNLKKIADELGIHPDKLYNNFRGLYVSLTDADKRRVANLLKDKLTKLFEHLGYTVVITKIED